MVLVPSFVYDSFRYCFDVPFGAAEDDNWLAGRILHLFISKVDNQSHPITVREREK